MKYFQHTSWQFNLTQSLTFCRNSLIIRLIFLAINHTHTFVYRIAKLTCKLVLMVIAWTGGLLPLLPPYPYEQKVPGQFPGATTKFALDCFSVSSLKLSNKCLHRWNKTNKKLVLNCYMIWLLFVLCFINVHFVF